MKRCRDCRFWGWDRVTDDPRAVPFQREEDEPRHCTLISGWPWYTGEHPLPHRSYLAEIGPWAGADDGALVTGPEFGCVEWAARV